ncbi:hypothetical protein C8R44DRAFT_856267 [Mycena epipterygia]|nr:hypothetical protein C8R44DRAFT_856267 [Mycena epipterygia]
MLLCRVLVSGRRLRPAHNVRSANRRSVPNAQIHAVSSFKACAAIRFDLSSPMVKSSGPEYNATATEPWGLFNSLDNVTCIVYPRTASHIRIAMASIFLVARNMPFKQGPQWYDGVEQKIVRHGVVQTCDPGNNDSTARGNRLTVYHRRSSRVCPTITFILVSDRIGDIETGLLLGEGINFVSPLAGWSAYADETNG